MSSTLLSRATSARRRTVSGLLATALAAATLAVTPGTAQAAEGDPTLSWNVSTQFVDHFTKASFNNNTLVASSGATYDAATKSATFAQESGWVNPVTKTASVQYDGSLKGSFISTANVLQYSIEIADPKIVLAADGTGRVVADVAWEVPTGTPTTGSSQDVVVTTFDGAGTTWGSQDGDATLGATPAFEGVLPAGSQAATDLGLTTNSSGTPVPIDGAAFAPTFLGALPSSLRAHFYKSGATSDTKKAPSAFAAAAARPSLTARTLTSTPDALEIEVSGRSYMAGGVGVYVSLGSAFSATDPSAFVATSWVNAIAADGSFTTVLKLPADKVAALDPAKTWTLSTQKAHGQSATDASQTVELPADLDFSTLVRQATTVSAPAVTTPVGKAATLTVDVDSTRTVDEGTVTLTGVGATATAPVEDGTATFTLPGTLPAGVRTATLSFGQTTFFAPATASTKVTVTKATTTAPRIAISPATTVRAGRATIDLTAGGAQPTGRVAVTLTKGTERRALTGTLVRGRATVAVPALSAGTWRATVSYAGDGTQTAATGTTTFVVRKASVAKPAVKVVKKPTTRKAGSVRVTVRSASAGTPTGKVRVQLVKGRSTKTYTVRLNSRGQANVKTSKLAKGSWKVYVTYYGDTKFDARAKVRTSTVKVTR
ncbi:Ig-like domain repeat protein [Aeromicrobium massiliense]|uniref:Ig-like domain repeat protein n=1 Tax=Aeromicrobium massiliense TaxID=1464554 RepID=UPI00057891FA|nr:Ig-like domain repeat protein [Aeromicrobium massiliense]